MEEEKEEEEKEDEGERESGDEEDEDPEVFQVCMSLGNDSNWFVVGTSRGYLLVYDMRFQLDVQWWRHPCQGEIHTVAQYQKLNAAWSSGGPHIVSAGGRNQGSEPSDDFGLRELDDLSLPEEGVRAVLSSPDGSYLLSGGRIYGKWGGQGRRYSMSGVGGLRGGDKEEGEEKRVKELTGAGGDIGIQQRDHTWSRRGGEFDILLDKVRHIVERRIPSTSAGNVGLKVRAPFAGSDARDGLSWGARGALAPPAEEHDDTVSQLAFLRSRHGSRILSSGWDGSVKVWA
ncbi:hypothetical protein GUITHDRAFT_136711 [Guillardia theta CCMP2712]|uniref:Uncharacterized protein n=1 Tax=Guillardia theta (strain CCMP2712) TaxID=905079 RepID=L1JKC7_GUITC|nr:hypothetical protein GUITHDRAFT_136711 [Guillardia theta CCMP2712]EKX48614.1 hypothetical protein GUITHDRAFT_136711 [Guillardia theta CCMP2712]|eukprot:XP_005835594.1 hypothetical protein GUITHDRAFT_136711 [Guillardia theta CCMP2712]